jgi:hypothetical protein
MHQLVPELSGSVTVTSTYKYSNPATKYLTETNSDGIVTGMPSNAGTATVVTGEPAVTSQPPVATIPAGISGTTVITINATAGLTSFTISAGKKTTQILGGADVSTAGGSSGGASGTGGGNNPQHTGSGNGNGNGNGGSGSSASASSSSTGAAAVATAQLASAGMIGLGAFFAALL